MLTGRQRARTIVEFGTSFGVSILWLAAAVRDNGGGTVVGTELVGSKAERARAHLREAGTAWLRDPGNGFVSLRVPFRAGTELSVRVSGHLPPAPPHRVSAQ